MISDSDSTRNGNVLHIDGYALQNTLDVRAIVLVLFIYTVSGGLHVW